MKEGWAYYNDDELIRKTYCQLTRSLYMIIATSLYEKNEGADDDYR